MSSSVDGLVSGLDTTNLVRQLMQVEAIPQQRLKLQVTDYTSDIKAYQGVAAALKKLDDAVAALAKPDTWGGTTASVTGDAATATARPGASAGSYGLAVTQLATARSWTTTTSYAMDAVVAGGSLTVRAPDGTDTVLDTGGGTLREVLAAVNGAAGLGVSAVAVRTADNAYRLQISSRATGADTGQLAVSGLSVPVTDLAGKNALYTVNDIAGESASNAVTDLVSGVDVTLVRPGSATVQVSADRPRTVEAIGALVTAANEALAEVRKQTQATEGTARGPLASDSLVRSLTGRIQRAVTDAVGGTTSADMGLQSSRTGELVLDKEKLGAALAADANAVRAVFAPQPVKGPDGRDLPVASIASRLRTAVDSATNVSTGFLTSAIQGRETSKKDLETQILSWDRRLELRQATLSRQFSALEVALGRLQSQSSYLSGQLAGLSRGDGS